MCKKPRTDTRGPDGQMDMHESVHTPSPRWMQSDVVMKLSAFGTQTHTRQNLYILVLRAVTSACCLVISLGVQIWVGGPSLFLCLEYLSHHSRLRWRIYQNLIDCCTDTKRLVSRMFWLHCSWYLTGFAIIQPRVWTVHEKRIGPSTRFYVHNFGQPRTQSDLLGHSHGHLQTSFSSQICSVYLPSDIVSGLPKYQAGQCNVT